MLAKKGLTLLAIVPGLVLTLVSVRAQEADMTMVKSSSGHVRIMVPPGWVIEEDADGVRLVLANAEAALTTFKEGELPKPGEVVITIGFIPAALFAEKDFSHVGIQLEASPDLFLQSIMPMLRITGAETADVSGSELVPLSGEREAGLATIATLQREGSLLVFEAAEGVMAFVSTVAYPGELPDLQAITFAVASSLDYTGSADALTAAFYGG